VKINITAGDCLNKILENKFSNEKFVPFNEAFIKGSYSAKLFSKEFMIERASTHNVSIEDYITKLHGFLDFLTHIKEYDCATLWFGNEPFCNENKKVVIQTLKEYNFQGKILLNTVIEETGEILKSETIQAYEV
jgi:hypothetical protein